MVAEGALVALGQVLVALLHAVGFRLITEAFPPSVFGEAALLIGVLTFVFAVTMNPLSATHYRFYPEYRARGLEQWFDRRVRRYLLKLLAVVGAAGLVAAICWSLLSGRQLVFVGAVLVATLVAQALYQMDTNVLSARRHQGRLVPLRVLRTGSYPALAALLAWYLGASLEILLAALAVSYALPSLGAWIAGWTRPERDTRRPPSHEARAFLRTALLYGGPIIFISIAVWTSNLGDRYLIAYYLTTADVGAYAAIYGLFSQPFLMLSGWLALWLRPILFDAMAADDVRRARSLLSKWITGGLACSLVGGSVLWWTRDWWMGLLLADDYYRAGQLVLFIVIANTMQVASSALSHHLMAAKQTRAELVPLLVAALLNIAGNVLLIPRMGIDGAALATAISFSVHALLLAITVRRVTLAVADTPRAL